MSSDYIQDFHPRYITQEREYSLKTYFRDSTFIQIQSAVIASEIFHSGYITQERESILKKYSRYSTFLVTTSEILHSRYFTFIGIRLKSHIPDIPPIIIFEQALLKTGDANIQPIINSC